MNKRGLIKFLFVLAAVFISFYYMIKTSNSGFDSMVNIVMIFNFLFALTIFMFSNKDKIKGKKGKFIYDVILMLLMLFSVLYFLYFTYSQGMCYFATACDLEHGTVFTIIYTIFLFLILLFGFKDISNKTNKTNDILTIIVSSLIILIHLRYYFDPKFIHNLVENDVYNYDSYYYVVQNYVYFVIMYLIVLIHHKVNKEI